MKKKILFLVLTVFALINKNFAQDTAAINGIVSLKQCVDIALKNNSDVYNSELQMETNKVNVLLAKGNMLPFVNGNISHGWSQGRAIDPFTNGYINQNIAYANYGVNGNLYLWNAGSIRNNVKANNLNYEASKMDWQQQKDNITISVILAYLQVLNNQEQLVAAKQQLEVSSNQAQRLEVLNKDGAIAPATLYDVKGQMANDELNVVNIKNTLETSKINLVQLMNIPYSAAMQFEKINVETELAFYEGTSQQIYQQAMQNLALIKAVDYRKQGAVKALKAAKGQSYPSLILNGALGTNYSNAATTSSITGTTDVLTENYVITNGGKAYVYSPQSSYKNDQIPYGSQWKNNFNSSFGISLQIPILNGWQTRSRINQAKVEEKRTTLDAQTTKTRLQQQVEQAYINMNSAFERYQTLQRQAEDFTLSFHSAEVRFNAGVITSVDYLVTKNNMDRSNINLIAAKYDYILRTKILDFYKGQLSF